MALTFTIKDKEERNKYRNKKMTEGRKEGWKDRSKGEWSKRKRKRPII